MGMKNGKFVDEKENEIGEKPGYKSS